MRLSEVEKSCGNCFYSYSKQDTTQHPSIGLLRQRCKNEQYTSPEYTEKMHLEDRARGYCRFWTPIKRKEE